MSHRPSCFVSHLKVIGIFFGATAALAQASPSDQTVALVKEQVSLDGGILDGNLHLTAPTSFTINGGFSGPGLLLFPGKPEWQIHQRARVVFLEEGGGSPDPSNYSIRLQARADLPGVRTRVDSPEFPSVNFPPPPTGHLDIRLGQGETFNGDPADIRDLTLGNHAGPFYLPPGQYGDLSVQRGARLILGIAGERAPATYSFTRIDWFQAAELELAGPVRLQTGSFPRILNGSMGIPDRPEWLTLEIAAGNWTLDRGASFTGKLLAPDGIVTLQPNSHFSGELVSWQLALQSNALLRYAGPSNQSPVAFVQSIETIEGNDLIFTLDASDPDGDSLAFILLEAPAFGTLQLINSGPVLEFKYTPNTGYVGLDSFSYRVSDGLLESEVVHVQIEILPDPNQIPDPPQIVSSPPTRFVVFQNSPDAAYEYQTIVESVEGGLFFTLNEAPDGASIDSQSGLLRWPVAYGNEGNYSFSVTVSDSNDSFATQEWSVEVVDNAPPIVTFAAPVLFARLDHEFLLGAGIVDSAVALEDMVIEWRQVFGPAGVDLASPFASETAAGFPATGVYGFEITVFDGEFLVTQRVAVHVGPPWERENPAGLAAWWSGNHTGIDLVSGISANLLSGTSFSPNGVVGGSFAFSGTTSGMEIPRRDSLDIAGEGEAGSFSIEFWIAPERIASEERIIEWRDVAQNRNGVALALWSSNQMILRLFDVNGASTPITSAAGLIVLNEWTHIAVTYDYASGVVAFYRNGAFHSQQTITRRQPETSLDLFIGHRSPNLSILQGNLDELSLYNRALRSEEISYLHALGGAGKIPSIDNLQPVVSAGPDLFLSTLHETTYLQGSASDDGEPFGELTTHWQQISGPGEAIFADPSQPATIVNFTEPGLYVLELKASDGMLVAHDRVNLRVGLPCESVSPPGLAAWWPWNRSLEEVVFDSVSIPRRHQMQFAEGIVATGLSFDGSGDGIQVERSPEIDVAQAGDFTIEFWVNPSRMVNDSRILEWRDVDQNRNGVALGLWGTSQMILRLFDATGASTPVTSGANLIAVDEWQHIAVTYVHETGVVTYFRDGVFHSQHPVTPRMPETSLDLFIGYRHPNLNFFQGTLDELSLYNRALRADEISLIHHLGENGKCPVTPNLPPVVSAGPDLILDSSSDVAALNGSVTDDGLPSNSLDIQWSLLSGPGTATFTNEALSATEVSFSEPGLYVLQLEGFDGMYRSFDYTTVRVGQPCLTANPQGLNAWWPFNGTLEETVTGLLTIPRRHVMTHTPGIVSEGLFFDGMHDGLSIESDPALDIGADGGFSIELWIQPHRVASDNRILEWRDVAANRNGVALGLWSSSQMILRLFDATGASTVVTSGTELVTVNTWSHIAVTYDYDASQVTFYRDGVVHSVRNVTRRLPETSFDLHIGYRQPNLNHFHGVMDELSLYNRPLQAEEIMALYTAGDRGKCAPGQLPMASIAADSFTETMLAPAHHAAPETSYQAAPSFFPNMVKGPETPPPGISFAQWREDYFSASVRLNDPTGTGPRGDPENSGIPNLLRYSIGMRDGKIDRSLLPRPVLVKTDGRPTLALSFHWRRGATDIDYIVEVSNDLVNWTDASTHIETIVKENVGETDRIVVKLRPSETENELRFLRLRVLPNPEFDHLRAPGAR